MIFFLNDDIIGLAAVKRVCVPFQFTLLDHAMLSDPGVRPCLSGSARA